jgi:hypothetical protein
MRKLSDAVKTVLGSDEVSFVYLVDIHYKEGVVRETTAPQTLLVNGNAYEPSQSLYALDAARLSSAVDRETYKIIYMDPNFEKRAMFEAGITNTRVVVSMCFVNTLEHTLAGYPPGVYMTNSEDIVIAYAGRVDTHGYTIDPEEGEIFAVIEGASPMASLAMTRSFMTSRDHMRKVRADDTAFDQTFVGAKRVGFVWGKK